MRTLLNFSFTSKGRLSQKLLKLGIPDFYTLIDYLRELPYGRISNYRNLELLLTEKCGTHTLKHAFLAQVARENQIDTVRLSLCAFYLDRENTEAAAPILETYGIWSVPEVTAMLKYKEDIFDITTPDQAPRAEILSEIEIIPPQIGNFKQRYHLNYIENWLQIEKVRHLSVKDIWHIREACIQAIKKQYQPQGQPFCCA